MTKTLQDLRFGRRTRLKTPAFSGAMAVPALGIGTHAPVFIVVDAVLLRPVARHG